MELQIVCHHLRHWWMTRSRLRGVDACSSLLSWNGLIIAILVTARNGFQVCEQQEVLLDRFSSHPLRKLSNNNDGSCGGLFVNMRINIEFKYETPMVGHSHHPSQMMMIKSHSVLVVVLVEKSSQDSIQVHRLSELSRRCFSLLWGEIDWCSVYSLLK